MDKKPLPVIYIREMPGRYFARVAGEYLDVPQASRIFYHRFRREPAAAYIERGFIYFPISEEEAGSLITIGATQ
jgi:hypothetical protein